MVHAKLVFAASRAALVISWYASFAGCASEAGARAPTVLDMVQLKTIDSLSISPDGRFVGYRLVTPNVSVNRVDVQWFRVALKGGNSEEMGGLLGPLYLPLFDMIENGKSEWSPDSRSLYVLAEAKSEVQVHRLDVGDRDDPATRDGADVISFSLDADGMGLHYETRNDRAAIDAAQMAAEAHGVLLQPEIFNEGLSLFRNYRIGNRRTTIRRAPDGTGTEAFSGPIQRKHLLFASGVTSITPTDESRAEKSTSLQPAVVGHEIQTLDAGNASITLRPLSKDNTGRTTYQVSVTVDGTERPCTAAFCQGSITVLRQLDWRESTGELIVRYAPEATRKTMVYGWNPRTDASRTIFSADGMLNGGAQFVDSPCAFSSAALVCVLSRSAEPPRLVRLDLDSGTITTLAAPNASLAARDMGITRFITWKDPTGRTSSGILTHPAAPTPGHLPLVVNLSSCPGFLEGGSVPLAPEHVLAGKGFASLCANINVDGIDFHDARGRRKPLAVHKAALVALRAIIDRLAADGTIDRDRVGIVGHSFGAMLAAYAVSHSDLFHAAVIGTGVTTDPTSFYLTAPEPESMRRTAFSGQGMPPADRDPSGVWPDVSAALNARRIRAPLLLLPPESEYLLGLQLYTSIRDAGGIARMIVYPGDGHLLSRQPGHQYEREINSLEWLGCWLTRSAPVTEAEKRQAAISASIPCQGQGFREAPPDPAAEAGASKDDRAKREAMLPHRPAP